MPGIKRKRNFIEITSVALPRVKTQFRWSDLPTEMKLAVLQQALAFDEPITPYTHWARSVNLLLPLELTSKEMCMLTMEAYYTTNHFVAQSVSYSWPLYSLSYPNPMRAHWIRNLTLKLSFSSKHSDNAYWMQDVFELRGQWKFLLNRMETLDQYAVSCEWYNVLRLTNLKIIIHMDDEKCFMQDRWKNLALDDCRRQAWSRMQDAYIVAKAKNYDFEVQGMRCVAQDGTSVCGGACTMIIKGMLQGMVKTD